MTTTTTAAPRQLTLVREFSAPRALVFKAWTDTAMMAQWWGPQCFSNPVCELDVRPGGAMHIVMRGPDGSDYPMDGIFHEIEPPSRLVFSSMAFKQEDGSHGLEACNTITFEEAGNKTKVTIQVVITRALPFVEGALAGMEAGWSGSLEKLEELMAQQNGPLVVERTLDAPAAAVWHALTDKAAMRQWYFDVSDFKPEVGFEFQFTGENEGFTYVHHCRVTAAEPNHKLAYSWRYEGYDGDSLVTFDLQAEGNQTHLRLTHTGLETFPPLEAFARKNFVAGWTEIIGKLLPEFVAKAAGATADREIVTSRTFEAPRELVWRAWTEPQHIMQWFGPDGFTNTIHEMAVRPGGVFRFIMHGPDGTDYNNRIAYNEVTPPERLVYDHDDDGDGSSPPFHVTVTFEARGDQTHVTLRALFDSAEACEAVKKFGAVEGGAQTLGRLGEHLKTMK